MVLHNNVITYKGPSFYPAALSIDHTYLLMMLSVSGMKSIPAAVAPRGMTAEALIDVNSRNMSSSKSST